MQQIQLPKIAWLGGITPGTNCVVGLDRDGVINRDIGTYCYKVKDFDPIPGSLEAVAELRRKGHSVVIITDQGGIEKGIYTETDVEAVHNHMFELLGQAGCASIDALYYSASSRKEDLFAKPNTGMFERCEKENKHIKFKGGYYVGDCMKDLKAAIAVKSIPVLVRTGHGLETEADLNKYAYRNIKQRTLVFDDLAAFVRSLP